MQNNSNGTGLLTAKVHLAGTNISADLHLEHLNRVCEEAIQGLGTNKTPTAVSRIGELFQIPFTILTQLVELSIAQVGTHVSLMTVT